MILIGLQNAEKKYEKTRHNAGAIILERFVLDEVREFEFNKYLNSIVSLTSLGRVYLPNTFMNLSGEIVKKILKDEKVSFSKKEDLRKEVFVFFDDVTIPVGQFKISVGEGASSHNGIKSILENLENNNTFTRIRIGVGKVLENGKLYEPGPERLSEYVLGNLNLLEISQIKSLSQKVIEELNKFYV